MKHNPRFDTGEYHFGDLRSIHGADPRTDWFGELKTLLGIAAQCFVTTLLIVVVLLSVAVMLEKVALAEPIDPTPVVETANPAVAFTSSCRSIKECA